MLSLGDQYYLQYCAVFQVCLSKLGNNSCREDLGGLEQVCVLRRDTAGCQGYQPANKLAPPPRSLITNRKTLTDTLSSSWLTPRHGHSDGEMWMWISFYANSARTHQRSQPGSLQDTCFCPPCFLPLAGPPLPFCALSISGEDKAWPWAWNYALSPQLGLRPAGFGDTSAAV